MALFRNVGSILKQNISQCSALSMLNSARYMSTKLFVGGLSYSTDDNSLRDAFSQHGEVVEARVIMDRETGRSRGFGFVEYTDSDSANAAVGSMDGQELHGRNIRVNVANDRPAAPRGGGYGGSGGSGGYNSGGGYGSGGYGSGGGGGGYQRQSYGGGNEDF